MLSFTITTTGYHGSPHPAMKRVVQGQMVQTLVKLPIGRLISTKRIPIMGLEMSKVVAKTVGVIFPNVTFQRLLITSTIFLMQRIVWNRLPCSIHSPGTDQYASDSSL